MLVLFHFGLLHPFRSIVVNVEQNNYSVYKYAFSQSSKSSVAFFTFDVRNCKC